MALKALNLHITNRCNIRCAHCLYESGDAALDEMSSGEIRRLVQEFAQLAPGGTINFFGGEPLLRTDIFELAETASILGLRCGVTTNIVVPERRLDELINSRFDRITVDIHGGTRSTHDWVRNSAGHFDKSLDAIRRLVGAGKQTSSNCALNRRSANEIEDVLELASSLGIYSLYPSTSCRRAAAGGHFSRTCSAQRNGLGQESGSGSGCRLGSQHSP